MPTPSADTHEWRQRASRHQVALMALAKERLQLNIVHIVTSQAPVKRLTDHIQTVGEPRGRRVAVPQPVKPGKFLIHSNLKLLKEPQRGAVTPKSQQRQLYLTGIPILTTVAPQEADRRAIVVKSLPRGLHALQVRNTDATYLIPVSCPDMTVMRAPSVTVGRPKPDPALQEQLMEFDKVCKEVKERSAPPAKKRTSTVAGGTVKETTAPAASRTDEEHKHAKIYAILAEYHKKLANSPDLNNKPAPRRRSAPPAGGTVVAKRKKVPVETKRPAKDPPTGATAGQLVNYVSIVRPLRIALGGQRLVALPSSTLTSGQSSQAPARPKVLVLDKPSGQYVIKQLSVAPPVAPKVESTAPHLPDCEDLGVDVPNASDLFPEADYLLEECLAPSDFGAEEVIDTPPADSVIRSVQ